jgi:hypothetical protein
MIEGFRDSQTMRVAKPAATEKMKFRVFMQAEIWHKKTTLSSGLLISEISYFFTGYLLLSVSP